MLATIAAALVLVTASACGGSGSAGQSMEKMTAPPKAMEQGGATPKGEMMPGTTMTKPAPERAPGGPGQRPRDLASVQQPLLVAEYLIV